MDPDAAFLSYLAVLAIAGIVLAVMEKRWPERAWNPSPAQYATFLVATGLLPLQIYLAWDGDDPTTGFIILCVVADIGVWLLAYAARKKRRPLRSSMPGQDEGDRGGDRDSQDSP